MSNSNVINCEFTVQGEGPPLILIHGIGSARDGWNTLLSVLCRDFTVVTYDLRGHGTSPLPTEEFGLDALVADLERVRERSGFDRVHIAGHSLGGMIGPAYAMKYPDRVRTLGLLSTAAGRTADDSEKVWSVVHAMEENGIEKVLKTLSDRWFTDAFISENPQIVEARMNRVLSTNPEVFMNVFRIYADTEMLPWLPNITKPALVLTGENDGGCNPRLNEKIASALPNAKLVILPEFKHSILLEAGQETATHLVDFIKANDSW